MKKRYYIISVLMLFVFSFNALGDEESISDGSGTGTITQFYSKPNGQFLRIQFSEKFVNPGKCEGEGFYIAELDDTAASNRFFSTVLAAFMAKKKVSFWINGCTNYRYWGKNRAKMTDIYVHE